MGMGAEALTVRRTRPALVGRVWQQVQVDDCFDLAAQMSFYFALSLLPFCLVLAMVVSWLPSTIIWKALVTWMVDYLPSQSRTLLFSVIFSLVGSSTGFLSLGLVTAIWSASSGVVSLMESLTVAYGSTDSRPYWRKHAIATGITLLAVVFVLANFGLMAFGRWAFRTLAEEVGTSNLFHPMWEIGNWAVTLILLCLIVDLMNFLLPDVRRPWRWLSPGTAFVVLTVVVSSSGFNLYLQHFSSYPKIYGALGGFIILMLWIYIASLILLIGAEIDHEIEKCTGEARVQ